MPKYGYLNIVGREVIPPSFSRAWNFSDFLAEARVDRESGFIDKGGHFVLPPQFSAAGPFKDGLAVIKKANITCVITKNGKIVATDNDINWLDRGGYRQGLLCAGKHKDKIGSCGFLDRDGNWAIEPQFGDVRPFSEGLAAFLDSHDTGLWGYINMKGEKVIPAQFPEAYRFSSGLAFVRSIKHKGYINREGDYVFKDIDKCAFLSDFSDGLARIVFKCTGKNQKYEMGYLNTEGQWAIEPSYYIAQDFGCGVAAVRLSHKSDYIYINSLGEQVIDEEFYDAYPFSEDIAVVGSRGRYGLINKEGKNVAGRRYNWLGNMAEGMVIFERSEDV